MKFNVFYISIVLGFLFIIAASTCKIPNGPLVVYRSKADCMAQILKQAEHEKQEVVNLSYIKNVEEYCKQYDR